MKRLAYYKKPIQYLDKFIDYINLKTDGILDIFSPLSYLLLLPVWLFLILISIPFYFSETEQAEKERLIVYKERKNKEIKKYNKKYGTNISLIK